MNGRARASGRFASALRRLTGGSEAELVPQTRLSGPMPWVIAIMVALTVIAVAAGLALRNTADSARAELEGGVTVQIVEPHPETRQTQSAAAVAKLQQMPGVISIRVVPPEELDSLIEPWLGTDAQSDLASAIPVPALIGVQVRGGATPQRVAEIGKALAEVAPSARVDAQSSWLEPVFEAIVSLQWLAIALVLLLALALAAAVLLAARTALGTNRDTIEIVHLLGGTDAQIARVFQRSIGVDAAGGGVVGLALAIVVILFLGRRFAGLGAGMIDNGALTWSDWLIMALVPVAAAILAMVTARFTVMHALRKML